MTRVLHVLEALEGGTARHLVDVVTHAHAVEHEVVVPPRRVGGLTDERAIARLQAAGATVHLLPMRRTPWAPHNAEALARLTRLVGARRPDVVHGHSSVGGVLARLSATTSGAARLYTANGITQVRAGRLAERALRPLTDRWIAVSASEGELALDLGLVDRARLAVVPNGIETEAVEPVDLRARLGLDAHQPLVGTVARLVPQKAPEQFVAVCDRVARAVPEARFVLIGGGELQDEFDAAHRRSGLGGRLVQVDGLPGAAGALGSLDVFVLTSRFEGGPYAPLEAMRAGTPVVLTDVVGNRDTVEPGRSGLLVPPGDPDAMAREVIALLRDGDRRDRIGRAGRCRVLAEFDVRAMGRRLDDLYAEVTSASG